VIEGALSGRVLALYPLALLVGVAYAWVIHRIESTGRAEGYAWLMVVVGVVLTLALCAPVIGLEATVAVGAMFVATGVPMIAVTIYRYEKARGEARRALYDDAEETLATPGRRSSRGSGASAPGRDEDADAAAR